MRLSLTTFVPRLALYLAGKLNGAHVGHGRDFWYAPKLSIVTLTAKDQPAMDHLLDSCRFWASTYCAPQPEMMLPVPPPVAFHACDVLCRRTNYPTE